MDNDLNNFLAELDNVFQGVDTPPTDVAPAPPKPTLSRTSSAKKVAELDEIEDLMKELSSDTRYR
jgi:hypothetical protein